MFHRIRTDQKGKLFTHSSENYQGTANEFRKKTNSKCGTSYSQKYKMMIQKNQQENVGAEILQEMQRAEGYLYQGGLKEGLKHGEGVLLTREGMLIIGRWLQDYLHGRALIFTPFGGKLIANFNEGKLNGWTFALFNDRLIICLLYYENRIDGEKLTYEDS